MKTPPNDDIEMTLTAIKKEYLRARTMFPAMNSKHEGVAVIYEEYLELQTEVFTNHNLNERNAKSYTEAKQLAAMCVAFMLETTGSP
jgi:hypothetical protein